ncbi:hypothetical protein Tco_0972472, partial [Tanacetum coccineum]
MAISVISISSDLSEESVGTSTARVILFGTIPTTIPATVPTADLPCPSPFICTNSSDGDTSERPPLHDPYKVTVARWRSRVAARSSPPPLPIHDSPPTLRQILPAPPGLPRRQLKSVGPLPTHRLALRYLADYSSWDHFTSDDSLRDSPSNSLSETSSDSPCDSPIAIFAGPSRKRRRSPTTLVPVASPVPGALSPVRADLLLPRKRIRDSDFVTDFKVSLEEGSVPQPREIGLGVNVEDIY